VHAQTIFWKPDWLSKYLARIQEKSKMKFYNMCLMRTFSYLHNYISQPFLAFFRSKQFEISPEILLNDYANLLTLITTQDETDESVHCCQSIALFHFHNI